MLFPGDSEGAGCEPEKGQTLGQQRGQFTALLRIHAAEGKHPVISAVRMQVQSHLDWAVLRESLYLLSDCVDLGLGVDGGGLPGPVEVVAREVAPEVAVDDAVHVEHGEDVEIEVREQPPGLSSLLLSQLPDDFFYQERGPHFAGVLPRQKQDLPLRLLLLSLLFVLFVLLLLFVLYGFAGNEQVGHLVTSDGVAD